MASVLVIAGTAPLSVGDSIIQTVLEGMGHTVTVVDQNQAYTAAQLDAYGLVVVAESVSSATHITNAGDAVRDTTAPVAQFEHGAWPHMGLASDRLRSVATNGNMWVVDDTHPAAGHLNNAAHEFTTATTNGSDYGVTLGSGAVVVYSWHEAKTDPNGFAYDTGAQMWSGTAPARRFGMGMHTDIVAGLRTPGEYMLEGIFHWLITGTALPSVEPASSVEILILAQEWESAASTADVAMKTRLAGQGWSVQIVDDDFWRDSWSTGRSLLIEVSSARGEPLWYSLNNINCPLITSEGEWTDRTMGLTASPPANGHGASETIYLEANTHPIAAGLTVGTITVHNSGGTAQINWCEIPRQAPYDIVAYRPGWSAHITVAAVEAGSTLQDGTTNAHRLVYHWHYHTSFDFYTADALALFDAAVDWAALTAPTLSSTGKTSTTIDLSWTDTGSAEWQVERNGSVIATTAALTYQDTGLSPSTEYTYRVRGRDVT